MSERVLELQGVHKRFGALEVLRGVDLVVPPSATMAIIGPSGSGKSTLVRCINYLERIQGGTISVGDVRISAAGVERGNGRLSGREIARYRTGIGMVSQSFNLFPHLTVLGNIIEAPTGVLGWDRKDAIERARALLRKVNLEDKAGSYPATLSGGQQQRVAIVRSLIMDPKIMLFDEPTSALDPEMINEVLEVMQALALDGMTMMVVTHEMGFAQRVAERVLFMDHGEILEDVAKAEFFAAPRTERARQFLANVLSH